MTEIQQNRWDQLIRRAAGIVGGGSQVNDTLNELFPVLDVERVPGELLLLMGTDISVGSSVLLGAAGQTGKIQLFNPAGSGKIVTVTSVIFSVDAITPVRLATTNTALTTGVATQTFRDRRHGLTARPIAGVFQESSVGFVDANILLIVLANEAFTMKDENGIAVLNPGSGLSVGPSATAQTLTTCFFWRERVAEASELRILGG